MELTEQEQNLIKDLILKTIENKNCDITTKMVGLSILKKIEHEQN